jgi:hypothetical protein
MWALRSVLEKLIRSYPQPQRVTEVVVLHRATHEINDLKYGKN